MKPQMLRRGDKVSIVSLSSGMLGEDFLSHQRKLGVKRMKELGLEPVFMPNSRKGIEYLRNHPEARAQDLKDAFQDETIKGIVCAIGGDDTYRLLPYLMEDEAFLKQVKRTPKLFTGFSDTTIDHLMFYKLGMQTFYGPNFICDLAELGAEMLPFTRAAFESYFENPPRRRILSSRVWYEERKDFSRESLGKERTAHEERKGFEVLQGNGRIQGRLLGGCLESLYDMLVNNRYEDEKDVCKTYGLFPGREEWKGKILFLETCEEKPEPQQLKKELLALKEQGVFEAVNGCLIGKPQDEAYYEEYKAIFREVIKNPNLPVLYNVNFGHAYPRCVLPYGVTAELDLDRKEIWLLEKMFE